MSSKLSYLLFFFCLSTHSLSASLLEDFDNENYAKENSYEEFSATDFLRQAVQQVTETKEMGTETLEMLDDQGKILGKIEHCHDERVVKALKRSSIMIHNLKHGLRGLIFGDVEFTENKPLRILEHNETYAHVKVKRLSGWIWQERILGVKENALVLFGKIFQRNYAKRIPLEEANVREVPDYECDDRQFCLEVAHKRNKLMFSFKEERNMVAWKLKLKRAFSKDRLARRKKQKEELMASLSEEKNPFSSDEERGPDGFTKKDHEFLDCIIEELDEIHDQAIEMGRVTDSHTRQIIRIKGKVEKSTEEVESQRMQLNTIH